MCVCVFVQGGLFSCMHVKNVCMCHLICIAVIFVARFIDNFLKHGLLCDGLLYHSLLCHGLLYHGLLCHGLLYHGLMYHGLL